MNPLSQRDNFFNPEIVSKYLPNLSLSEWQNDYKYKKETKFYCGWTISSYGRTASTVMFAGWEPQLQLMYVFGIIPDIGCGWSEVDYKSFCSDQKHMNWIAVEVFKEGPLVAEELAKRLYIPINFQPGSTIELPTGGKMFL